MEWRREPFAARHHEGRGGLIKGYFLACGRTWLRGVSHQGVSRSRQKKG